MYHCLLSIFLKILSSHTIVWILATAFGHFLVIGTVLQNPCGGGSTYHTSLEISFDHPTITSGKKIVALDEMCVMVLTTVVIDKWTTTASSPSLNRHGLILYWRQAFLGNSNELMGPDPVPFSMRGLTNIVCSVNRHYNMAISLPANSIEFLRGLPVVIWLVNFFQFPPVQGMPHATTYGNNRPRMITRRNLLFSSRTSSRNKRRAWNITLPTEEQMQPLIPEIIDWPLVDLWIKQHSLGFNPYQHSRGAQLIYIGNWYT